MYRKSDRGSPVGDSDILTAMAAATVHALQMTPVKGLRVVARGDVYLTPAVFSDDRRFYLVDERGRMVNGKQLGTLNEIVAVYEHGARTLELTFPDGTVVAGAGAPGGHRTAGVCPPPPPAPRR